MSGDFFREVVDEGKRQQREDSEARWEEALVRHTLSVFKGGPAQRRQLYEHWHRATGNDGVLRFSAFNNVYPYFPIVLGSTRLDEPIHRCKHSIEPARYKKFTKVPFVVAYQDFFSERFVKGDLRSIGLVFPRRGFKHGLVIHNDDSETSWTQGSCWVYKTNKGVRLYVQPYLQLLNGIKEDKSFSLFES
jgi:hypothetical protein